MGAGIVGLATAFRLQRRRPSVRVTVVEAEDRVGAHQSSHNSGVLHAGVYYAPGSRKARWCREGKAAMERFCAEHGVPVVRHGKVVVAVDEDERPRLAALEQRARENGVPGLRALDPAALAEIEPHVAGVAALHSPTTASTDFGAVCRALAERLVADGVTLRLGERVVRIDEAASEAVVVTDRGDLHARAALACAGLQADRLARASGAPADPRIVPFRGSWWVLAPRARALVNGHVYPVPDPALPFLGVHLSPRVDGEVWVGPNAVLAAGRHAYGGDPDLRDLAEVARTPSAWRLAKRHWRHGARELLRDRSRRAALAAVQRYVPALTDDDLTEERPVGIRAQALARDGTLVDDFAIDGSRRVVHVRNAPSPAATASLAIGDALATEVLDRLA